MAAGAPIQWGRILLSAVLAAIIAMALIFGGLWVLRHNPGVIVDRLCPPDLVTYPEPEPTGDIITDIISAIFMAIVYALVWLFLCAIAIAFLALLIYFPLAVILSIILIRLMVQQRRLIHTILTVILSIPVAYGLLFLLSRIL